MLLLVLVLMFGVVALSALILSYNFYMTDFAVTAPTVLESYTFSKQNSDKSIAGAYYNWYNQAAQNSWAVNFSCLDEWLSSFTDQWCYFRGEYWFIPPQRTLKLWVYQNISWSGFVFNVLWNVSKDVTFNIKEINWPLVLQKTITTSGYVDTIPFTGKDFSIEIVNPDTSWVQYFFTTKWSEWLKSFSISSTWIVNLLQSKASLNPLLRGQFDAVSFSSTWSSAISSAYSLLSISSWNLLNFQVANFSFNQQKSSGAFLLTSPVTLWTWVKINFWYTGSQELTCTQQLRWFYYDSHKGNVLYWIDSTSHSQALSNNVWLTWSVFSPASTWFSAWLYTNCSSYPDSVFGSFRIQSSTWTDIITMTAWVMVSNSTGIPNANTYVPSLNLVATWWVSQLIWTIYSTQFWLGVVWGIPWDTDLIRRFIDRSNALQTISSAIEAIWTNYINFASPVSWFLQRNFEIKY